MIQAIPLGKLKIWLPVMPPQASSLLLLMWAKVCVSRPLQAWDNQTVLPDYFILPKIMSLLRRNTMETYNRHGGQALVSQIMSVSLHSDATFIWRQKTSIQVWFNTVFSHKHFCHTWWKQRNLISRVIPNICSMRIRKLSCSSIILHIFLSICDDWSQHQVYQGTEESYRAFWNFLFEVRSVCLVGLKG